MTIYNVKLLPTEVEFSEGIESTVKICAWVDELDCVAEITGIEFDDDVPDFIKNKILTSMKGRIISITNTFDNDIKDEEGNITTANTLYNYSVEIDYQKPLITTNEAAKKVMNEHIEKLKNDEGIKGVEKILEKLNSVFSTVTVPTVPTVVSNITNPLIVGTEINSDQMENMREVFTDALDKLQSINHDYFRSGYNNVNDNNDVAQVNREFNKFIELYNNKITEYLVDNSSIEGDRIISSITTTINNSNGLYINFKREEKYIISSGLVELNNLLSNVFSEYNKEYDNGVISAMVNEATEINKSIIDRCS